MCRLAKATSWESKLAYNPQTYQCGQVGQTAFIIFNTLMVAVVITCMCHAVLHVAVGVSCGVIVGKFLSHDKSLSTKYFLLCPPPQHLIIYTFYTSAEINKSLKMNFHNPNLGEKFILNETFSFTNGYFC